MLFLKFWVGIGDTELVLDSEFVECIHRMQTQRGI